MGEDFLPPPVVICNYKYFIMKSKVLDTISIFADKDAEHEKIKEAFEIFKKHRPHLFKVWQSMNSVAVLSEEGYENFIYYDLKVFLLKTATVLEMENHFLASLFVHEAQHLVQYKKNPNEFDDEFLAEKLYEDHERDAYETQQNFLREVGTQEDVEWLKEQFENKWWIDNTNSEVGENIAMRDGDHYRKIAEKYITRQ